MKSAVQCRVTISADAAHRYKCTYTSVCMYIRIYTGDAAKHGRKLQSERISTASMGETVDAGMFDDIDKLIYAQCLDCV